MKIFFNDLSTGDPEMRLLDNLDKVLKFSDLISCLNKKIGISVISASQNFYALRLCDTIVSECAFKKEYDFDKRNLIAQLFNYFSKDTEIDKEIVFTHQTTGKDSILLGNAHRHLRPSISFTFDKCFECNQIDGTINNRPASIFNLYDSSQEYEPKFFVSPTDCKQYDPRISPLWNLEASNAYHNNVKAELDSITRSPERKIAILEKTSSHIAELNGWELDEGLTKINRTVNNFRRIFRSSKFSISKAYLSIDFEKADIYFELYDKRGKHLGEYRWDGTVHKDPDTSGKHDIIVR